MKEKRFGRISRRGFLVGAGLAFGGIGVLGEAVVGGRKKSKPNILYLMADQHRGDCLGCALLILLLRTGSCFPMLIHLRRAARLLGVLY